MRPGYRTTEFWLSLAAVLVGAVMASGVFAAGSWPLQALGVVATVLGALGYNGGRTSVKKAEASKPSPWPPPAAVGREQSIETEPPKPHLD